MRRSLIALSVLLLLAGVSAAQKRKTDWQHDGLIGRVQRVREEVAMMRSHSGTWKEDGRQTVKITGYDKDGNLREEIFGSGPNDVYYSYYYTKQGDRIQSYNWGIPSEGAFPDRNAIIATVRFKYDADGNRIEEASYKHGSFVGKVTTTYDSTGLKHQQIVYDREGRTIGRSIFGYDEKKSLTLVSDFTSPSALKIKEAYAYEFDSLGNWIKRTTSKPVPDSKPTRLEPVWVIYRNISYY